MASLQDWVGDQLHGLLGMSESNLVEYVIALARRSKDEANFLSSLRENGIAISDDSRRFAVQLMKKVPRPQVDNKAAEQAALTKKLEKERQQKQIDLLKKNDQYALVDDPDADVLAAQAALESKRLAKLEKKEEKREAKREKKEMKRQLRKKSKWSEDEGEGEQHAEEPASKKVKVEGDDADDALEDWEVEELERVKDREDRDAFAARLKKRDDARTRKLTVRGEKLDPLAEGGEAPRQRISAEERELIFEESRIVSRQAYLEKRENKKIDELVESIEDEKRLFEGLKLTAREKRDFAVKQRVLDLVKQRNDAIDRTPNYVMPESYDDTARPEGRSRRYKVLDSRHDEVEDKVLPTDCDVHESVQLEHAAIVVDFVRDAVATAEINFLEPPDEASVQVSQSWQYWQ